MFAAATFALGRLLVRHDAGEQFWITDRERTVVDTFRLPHQLGEDVAFSTLRRYLSDRALRARLAAVARPLRAWRSVSRALRVMEA